MTRNHLLIGGGLVVVLLAFAFAIGRATAPTRTVTVTQTVTVEKRVEVAAKSVDAVSATDQGIHWRTRTVYKPGGTTVVTKEVVRENKATTATHTEETRATATAKEAATQTVRIVERPKLAQWGVGMFAGMGLGGDRHVGGEVSRRLFGPVWLEARVDAVGRAGTLNVRVEF